MLINKFLKYFITIYTLIFTLYASNLNATKKGNTSYSSTSQNHISANPPSPTTFPLPLETSSPTESFAPAEEFSSDFLVDFNTSAREQEIDSYISSHDKCPIYDPANTPSLRPLSITEPPIILTKPVSRKLDFDYILENLPVTYIDTEESRNKILRFTSTFPILFFLDLTSGVPTILSIQSSHPIIIDKKTVKMAILDSLCNIRDHLRFVLREENAVIIDIAQSLKEHHILNVERGIFIKIKIKDPKWQINIDSL